LRPLVTVFVRETFFLAAAADLVFLLSLAEPCTIALLLLGVRLALLSSQMANGWLAN
jgi:hypothetical protein